MPRQVNHIIYDEATTANTRAVIIELEARNLISVGHVDDKMVVGRHGTNKRTLKGVIAVAKPKKPMGGKGKKKPATC